MGRPPFWTAEKKAEAQACICEQIAIGRSLVSICKDDGMPAYSLVMAWCQDDDDFRERYARARELQADYIADEIIDIADGAKDANIARLQIDARKWKAGKLRPKVYGDRLNLDADVNLSISDEQVDARLAHLLGKAGAAGAARGEGEEGGAA